MLTTVAIVLGLTLLGGLTAWSFLQKEHSGLRIYGPVFLTRYIAEELRPKITQYLERPGDGRPFSLITRSWVYRASKGLSTKEGFGTTRDMHQPGAHVIVPAPFGYTSEELPDDSFSHTIGSGDNQFEVRYPVIRSAMSFGALGAMATRSLSDGTAILGEGALDNTGEGGLSVHHCPVNEEGERYRVALNERSKLFGRPYTFRFDKAATSDGKVIDVPLQLSAYRIAADGSLETTGSVDLAASEMNRNLILQIGPSMSGYKDAEGNFDWEWFEFVLGLDFVAGVEVKLHQGAKPNDGGSVPAEKLTKEIAALRSIPLGKDYVSPERSPLISIGELDEQVLQLIQFINQVKNLPTFKSRGLIIGLKTTYVGEDFANLLADWIGNDVGMTGPDYIQVDGAEGGTGSSDTVLTDRVGFHTYHGIKETHRIFTERGVRDRITIIGSGRLVEPGAGVMAMCLGADILASARGPMLSLGCIQSRLCNTDKCPAGIATHNSWRLRGLDPTVKSTRYANYVIKYRSTLVKLARSAGVNLAAGEKFNENHLWIAE